MLEVRSIAKRYGDVLALTDLTVDVGERSCLVLLGRNGAGKTTALRCMAGVLAPSAGTVRVDGIDAASEPAAVRARVGLMPELPGLYETRGTVVADDPGLRVHGFQFTPALQRPAPS